MHIFCNDPLLPLGLSLTPRTHDICKTVFLSVFVLVFVSISHTAHTWPAIFSIFPNVEKISTSVDYLCLVGQSPVPYPCNIMQLWHVEYLKGHQIRRRSKQTNKQQNAILGQIKLGNFFWQIHTQALSSLISWQNTFLERFIKDYIWKYFFVQGQRGKTGCLKFEMVSDVISDRSQLTWPMPLENT